MKVEKLDHVHIHVKDIKKAVQFFENSLGVKFGTIYASEEWDFKICHAPPGLLLMQPMSPENPVAQLIESRGEGLAAISLKVPDIEAAIAELQSKGLTLTAKVIDGDVKEAFFDPADSFGVEIELCEYPGDDINAAADQEMLSRAAELGKQGS
ncbi:VOC family protein [Chloroflexota bacterium]